MEMSRIPVWMVSELLSSPYLRQTIIKIVLFVFIWMWMWVCVHVCVCLLCVQFIQCIRGSWIIHLLFLDCRRQTLKISQNSSRSAVAAVADRNFVVPHKANAVGLPLFCAFWYFLFYRNIYSLAHLVLWTIDSCWLLLFGFKHGKSDRFCVSVS